MTSRERQAIQEHFIDLCQLAGHETSNEYDPTDTRFAASGWPAADLADKQILERLLALNLERAGKQ